MVETSDFLPFGTRWSQTAGSSSSTLTDASNRWRYSGKEEQKTLNSSLPLIDYGARMYDPTIARWLSVDPMAEKYYPLSPYVYCAGNPLKFIDPTGMKWEDPIQAESLRKTINKRIEKIEKNIVSKQNSIEKGQLSETRKQRFEGIIIENQKK